MKLKDIYLNLCLYDKRNPAYNIEDGEKQNPCYCDNCFYGRNKLALEILKLKGEER